MRFPIHVGNRDYTANENGGKALHAVPLLPGEEFRQVRLDCIAMTATDGVSIENFDQPPLFAWWGAIFPFAFGATEAVSTADIDAMIDELDKTASGEQYLGGDPTFAATEESIFGSGILNQPKVWFNRVRIGRPVPIGADLANNADSLFYDEFHTAVHPKLKIMTPSILLFGCKGYKLDAQTNFSIEALDDSTTPSDILNAYTFEGDAGGVTAQLKTLFYGGDNYIESDSFKESKKRYYSVGHYSIVRNQKIGV